MKPTSIYSEMSVWILNSIYKIYWDKDDYLIRVDDYHHFSTIEWIWNNYYPEPELSLKKLLCSA
jgi:hypothetical protein